jgi:hypothetical protein
MGDYADIISENIEKIAKQLTRLNDNIETQNKILLASSDTFKKNTPETIAKLRTNFSDIIKILKD